MKRRYILYVLCLSLLTGCIFNEGKLGKVDLLVAWEVEPEENAEVIAPDDERIADIEPIQRLLQRVREEEPMDGFSDYAVSIRDYDDEDRAEALFAEAAEVLDELPQYSHPEADMDGSYIRTNDTVALITYEAEE